MILLEFVGAIIRYSYLRIIKQRKLSFTDIWKTFDFKSRDAFSHDTANYNVGIAFVCCIILIMIIFFD